MLARNDRAAGHNREHLQARGVVGINLMGSPGAGKTAVLEATARAQPDLPLAAVSGDLATDRDAERLRAAGIQSVGITTGSACHLDARLVHRALHRLDLSQARLLFIENVGNLVCPSLFDLGESQRVVIMSITEGEDKPLKYPVMFQRVDLVLLTKLDLLPHLPEVSVAGFRAALQQVAPALPMIGISATSGEGLGQWGAWLRARLEEAGSAHAAAGSD
jgi:hydrogenase nickel incorporation protein HypB